MKHSQQNYELNILIGGKAIMEYEHEGNIFVEGRKGSEFEVEFKNRTNKQVLVIPSVDGKSVFDGKPATPQSQGYVVRAYGQIRIPGWTLDNHDVAKFAFADKEASYSAATTQEGEEVVRGVVGVLIFVEKEKPQPVHVHHHHHNTYPYPGVPRTPWPQYPGQWPYNGPTLMGSSISSADAKPMSKSVTRGATAQSATLSASSANASHENTASTSDPFEMGTAFGQKAKFETTTVAFERGSMEAPMQLYYDSRRNLEKRGIVVAKKDTRHLNELPQAFQGTGCTPPPGWQG